MRALLFSLAFALVATLTNRTSQAAPTGRDYDPDPAPQPAQVVVPVGRRRVETRPRWALVAGGLAASGVGYLAWTGALNDRCKVARGDDEDYCAAARLPLVGPWYAVGRTVASGFESFRCPDDAPVPCVIYPVVGGIGFAAAIMAGALQVGGLGVAAAGFLFPEKREPAPRARIRPSFGPGGAGVEGTF